MYFRNALSRKVVPVSERIQSKPLQMTFSRLLSQVLLLFWMVVHVPVGRPISLIGWHLDWILEKKNLDLVR